MCVQKIVKLASYFHFKLALTPQEQSHSKWWYDGTQTINCQYVVSFQLHNIIIYIILLKCYDTKQQIEIEIYHKSNNDMAQI